MRVGESNQDFHKTLTMLASRQSLKNNNKESNNLSETQDEKVFFSSPSTPPCIKQKKSGCVFFKTTPRSWVEGDLVT